MSLWAIHISGATREAILMGNFKGLSSDELLGNYQGATREDLLGNLSRGNPRGTSWRSI
jgi:hypothetical protein